MVCVKATAQDFNSGVLQVPLIELYTSEGCSSCPPADRWLSSLKHREGLWAKFVPIALHVDYWDYIGWHDPFASPEYSQRQRHYAHEYKEPNVYTPGVRRAGEEWREWRGSDTLGLNNIDKVGNLSLSISKGGAFNARFDSLNSQLQRKTLQLNIAVLGLNLKTKVERGENQGRTLKHDFVVLQLSRFSSAQENQWSGTIDTPKLAAAEYAIAAWLSDKGSARPLQACGGYLDSDLWEASL